jgi:hypothetical protein
MPILRLTEEQSSALVDDIGPTPPPAGSARPRGNKRGSTLERRVAAYLAQSNLPAPRREYRFSTSRNFRFDFAWPALGVALEIEGGIWTQGAHTRGVGYVKDCEKYNLATLEGWRVFRVTERQLRDGSAYALLRVILSAPIVYAPPRDLFSETEGNR